MIGFLISSLPTLVLFAGVGALAAGTLFLLCWLFFRERIRLRFFAAAAAFGIALAALAYTQFAGIAYFAAGMDPAHGAAARNVGLAAAMSCLLACVGVGALVRSRILLTLGLGAVAWGAAIGVTWIAWEANGYL